MNSYKKKTSDVKRIKEVVEWASLSKIKVISLYQNDNKYNFLEEEFRNYEVEDGLFEQCKRPVLGIFQEGEEYTIKRLIRTEKSEVFGEARFVDFDQNLQELDNPLIINFFNQTDNIDYIAKNIIRGEKNPDNSFEKQSRYFKGFEFAKQYAGVEMSDYETALIISFSGKLKNLGRINFQFLYNSEIQFCEEISDLNFLEFYRILFRYSSSTQRFGK